jgi:thioredoxin reductase
MDQLMDDYDVVVIGGGAAGLNGALMLARSRRRVVVIDAGEPRNSPAEGVHGLLGHDGVPPAVLLARGCAEVRRYGGEIVAGAVVGVARADDAAFVVALADGRSTRARRLLVTTGLVDRLPAVAGLRERWGRDVLHCPYCHGWEVRDQAIGVLANGARSVHQALLFRQLSGTVTYFVNGTALPEDEQEQLEARAITIVDGAVVGVEVADDRVIGVRMADGRVVAVEAVAVMSQMEARTEPLAGLGLRSVPHPSGIGVHIPVDGTGRTEVPGVWAAGNVTDIAAQVGASAAAGAFAAAQINADLVAEETAAAVAAHRLARSLPAS